jgi:RNA 2',3'-cyclic 3'-phosphodiesterase
MARLFVAADLPDEARNRLLAVRPHALPGVRLVGRQEMHLTLHFIGEVEDDHIAVIRGALERVKAPPFAIDLEVVGRFPHEGDARVLWAGVRGSARLSALHQTVGTALAAAIGYIPEDRPYHPHVTLARLDTAPPRAAVEDYLDEHTAFEVAAVPITRFSLYSSTRTRQGPRYEAEATFDLSAAGTLAGPGDGRPLHLVYLRDGRMLLTKKVYRDWRVIQDEYEDYMTSLGPWSEAEVIDFLESEYPDLVPVAGRVHSFIDSEAEVLVL